MFFSLHIRTVHHYIIRVLFSHQLMHQWVVLENNIKICIKIYIKTATTCFGVTVFTFVPCIFILSEFYLVTNWCTSELS